MITVQKKELFHWRRAKRNKQEVSVCARLTLAGTLVFTTVSANAGPVGGEITVGSGSITQNDADTLIDQTTNRLDIDWQDFSSEVGESITFAQPNELSIAINRVIGGVPSELRGALTANGRVFIINDAGITFHGTSQVNVGSLIATTANTLNEDDGRFSFIGSGTGNVINHGYITVSEGGFAILAAPYVENTGYVQADLGEVHLAGTNSFSLDLKGDGLINFVVSDENADVIAAEGDKLGVDNSGTLRARSGLITITAETASQMIDSIIGLNGVIDADAFAEDGNGGTVLLDSRGSIEINDGAVISADAGANGDGGTVLTWADQINYFKEGAKISARGGDETGDGGFVEVSANKVVFKGDVDASAPNGANGELLIDPAHIVILDQAATTAASAFGTGTVLSTAAGTAGSTTYIKEDQIETLSQGGTDVRIEATKSITLSDLVTDGVLSGGSGNITLQTISGTSGSIAFANTDNTIKTTSGDIRIRTLNTSVGTNTDAASGQIYSGGTIAIGNVEITDGGALEVKAGNGDLNIGSIDVHAGDGNDQTALADVDLHAFGTSADVVINGDVSVTAQADHNLNTGGTDETASAMATLDVTAGNNIRLNGDLSVDAQTLSSSNRAIDGSGASVRARATAAATLVADGVHLSSDGSPALYSVTAGVTANNNSAVTTADDGAEASVFASADLSITANEADIELDGSVNVAANAYGYNNSATAESAVAITTVTAIANASFMANEDVILHGDSNQVTASAISSQNHASADNSDVAYGGAVAYGTLMVSASGDATVEGSVSIDVDAQSLKNNVKAEGDYAHGGAAAYGLMSVISSGVTVTDGITVDAITIDVDALSDENTVVAKDVVDGGASYGIANAYADAELSLQAVDGGVTINDDVTVSATADSIDNDASASYGAYAMARAAASVDIDAELSFETDYGISVTADALTNSNNVDVPLLGYGAIAAAMADAQLNVSVDDGTSSGSAFVAMSGFDVLASAQTLNNTVDGGQYGAYANASADANATILAQDSVTINGSGDVEAYGLSSDNTVDVIEEFARADASVEADLVVTAYGENGSAAYGGMVSVTGDLGVTASAETYGNSVVGYGVIPSDLLVANAYGDATATINGKYGVSLTGDLDVNAVALSSSNLVSASYGVGALASALASADGQIITEYGAVTVDGDVSVAADAETYGNTVNAYGSGANARASANATGRIYSEYGAGVSMINDSDLVVTADALASGNIVTASYGDFAVADAYASAYGYVEADDGVVDVDGTVRIDATAESIGNTVSVGEDTVRANADADAYGYAYGAYGVSLGSTSSSGGMDVSAVALSSSNTITAAGSEAYGSAEASAYGAVIAPVGVAQVTGAMSVEADAKTYGNVLVAYGDDSEGASFEADANANARGVVMGEAAVVLGSGSSDGDIQVTATAISSANDMSQFGSQYGTAWGSANATASAYVFSPNVVYGAGTVEVTADAQSVSNSVDVAASSDGGSVHLDAFARAYGEILGFYGVMLGGSSHEGGVDVTATALSSGNYGVAGADGGDVHASADAYGTAGVNAPYGEVAVTTIAASASAQSLGNSGFADDGYGVVNVDANAFAVAYGNAMYGVSIGDGTHAGDLTAVATAISSNNYGVAGEYGTVNVDATALAGGTIYTPYGSINVMGDMTVSAEALASSNFAEVGSYGTVNGDADALSLGYVLAPYGVISPEDNSTTITGTLEVSANAESYGNVGFTSGDYGSVELGASADAFAFVLDVTENGITLGSASGEGDLTVSATAKSSNNYGIVGDYGVVTANADAYGLGVLDAVYGVTVMGTAGVSADAQSVENWVVTPKSYGNDLHLEANANARLLVDSEAGDVTIGTSDGGGINVAATALSSGNYGVVGYGGDIFGSAMAYGVATVFADGDLGSSYGGHIQVTGVSSVSGSAESKNNTLMAYSSSYEASSDAVYGTLVDAKANGYGVGLLAAEYGVTLGSGSTEGDFTVNAHALSSNNLLVASDAEYGVQVEGSADALATLIIDTDYGSITGAGEITVSADAYGLANQAYGYTSNDPYYGAESIADLDVEAAAYLMMNGPDGVSLGDASHAGDITVTADALSSNNYGYLSSQDNVNASAQASASGEVYAEYGTVFISGSITASAEATTLNNTAVAAEDADADADADANFSVAGTYGVTLGSASGAGTVTVSAVALSSGNVVSASYGGLDASAEGRARADVEADYGEVVITGGVEVTASADSIDNAAYGSYVIGETEVDADAYGYAEIYGEDGVTLGSAYGAGTVDVTVSALASGNYAVVGAGVVHGGEYGREVFGSAEAYGQAVIVAPDGEVETVGSVTVDVAAETKGNTLSNLAYGSAASYGGNVNAYGNAYGVAYIAGEYGVTIGESSSEAGVSVTVDALSSNNTVVSEYGAVLASANAYGYNKIYADNGSISINGLVELTVDAQSLNNVASALDQGSLGRDVDADADAEAYGSVDIRGEDGVTLGSAAHDGGMVVSVDALSSGNKAFSEYGNAFASADAIGYGEIEADEGEVTITGTVTVEVDAKATANTASVGEDNSGRASADADAVGYGYVAGNYGVTINGSEDGAFNVSAAASATSNRAYGDELAEAGAEASAEAYGQSAYGDVTITGDVSISADARSVSNILSASSSEGYGYGQADAIAYGSIDAYGDVTIGTASAETDIAVTATALASDNTISGGSDAYGKADADADLYIDAHYGAVAGVGDLTITAGATSKLNSANAVYGAVILDADAEAYGDIDGEMGVTLGSASGDGSVTVITTALSSSNSASLEYGNNVNMSASAEGYAHIDGNAAEVDVAGSVTVTASAQTISNSGLSAYGSDLDADADATAYGWIYGEDGVTLGGDLDISATGLSATNTLTAYGASHDASGEAAAYGLVEASSGSVSIGGDVTISASGQSIGNSLTAGYGDNGEADGDAYAYGWISGEDGVTLGTESDGGDFTVSAVAVSSSNGISQLDGSEAYGSAEASAYGYIDASSGAVSLQGDVAVSAEATSYGNLVVASDDAYGNADAHASADIDADDGVTIAGDLTVTADAMASSNSVVATSGSNASGEADADAILMVEGGSGEIHVYGDLTLSAIGESMGNYGFANTQNADVDAEANANGSLIAASGVSIDGGVEVVSSVYSSSNVAIASDGTAQAEADAYGYIELLASDGAVNVGEGVAVAVDAVSSNNRAYGDGFNIGAGAQAYGSARIAGQEGVDVGSDISLVVTALSSGNRGTGYGADNNDYGVNALASADLQVSADSGSVVIGGGVVVAADAESASNEVYVSDYGDAYASAVARADGYIHADDDVVIGADVEISAEADSSNNSAYVSSDDAIVSAYGVAYGAVISSNGNVSITGDFEVAASADATGNEAYGDDDAAAGATAVAFGNILAYNSVVVEGVSVTADAAASSNFASADDFVNAGAGALAYGLVLAEHGSVTASGDVGFSAAADANSNTIHSEYGAAHAGAIGYSRGFVTADTGVTIDGDLSFGADATAADNVVMAYGIGDDAGANGLAVAIGMASASDGSVVIGGDAMLSADAETRGNSVEADEDAFANAYGIGVMGLHAQDDILIGGDLLASGVVSASNNDVDGSSNGIAGATGTLFVTTEADEGNVEVTGVVDLTLDVDSVSNNANSYVGAFAYGVVNLEGANTILNSGASVSVEALSSANDGTNARAYGMGMLYANADGGADTGDLTLTGGVTVDGNAYAYSNSASFTTASANAGAVLTADENLTLTGDIDVSASAENNHDGSVFANAYMSAVAGTGSASGDLVIYDDVAVSAHVDSESGSNSAIAYGTASIYALHDVKVEGDIDVEVTVDKDTVVGGYGYALADIAAGTNGSSGTSADGDVFLLGTARTMVDSVDEQVVEDAHTRVQTTGGDIYLLGYDPIADATPAYLQTHVTDEDVSGDSRARVTITPNGGDTVWGYTEDWEHMLVLESTWQGVILKTPYDPMGQLPPLSIGPNGEIQFNNGIADPNLAEEFCNRFSKFSCETGDAL